MVDCRPEITSAPALLMAFERWDFRPLEFKDAPSGITMPNPERYSVGALARFLDRRKYGRGGDDPRGAGRSEPRREMWT